MFCFVLILYCGYGIVITGISAACFCRWEEMNMEYKEKIIEMVNEIDRKDILRYIYIIISDIVKEEKEREKNGSK